MSSKDNENVLDLEEYRKRRVAEGTWPPDPETLRDYWNDFRRRRDRQKTSK